MGTTDSDMSGAFDVTPPERESDGTVKRVPVRIPWAGSNVVVEDWFECADGAVWRLVEPDPPATGLFDRVDPGRPEGR